MSLFGLNLKRGMNDGGVKAVGVEDIDVAIEHVHATHGIREVGAEEIDQWAGHSSSSSCDITSWHRKPRQKHAVVSSFRPPLQGAIGGIDVVTGVANERRLAPLD